MEPGDALLAMYILDESGWALPTQQMVHRSVIDSGVLFEKASGINTLYDSWFNARVRACGPTLVYNSPLVEWHQGRHKTPTSAIPAGGLTAEFIAFRKLVLPLIPKDRCPPELEATEGMVLITRALDQLRNMRLLSAIRTAAHTKNAHAYWLAIGWFLRRY